MAIVDFELDAAGVREVLHSAPMRQAVNGLARQIAAGVTAAVPGDVPVQVEEYTTDREAAAVVIAHPSGMALQARSGVLTRSAAAVGLDVRMYR